MDTAARLIICVILGAFYAPVATAYEWPAQYENLQVVDGDLHVKRPGGGTSHVWPDIKINKEIPVNTSKGNYLVPVEKTLPISSAKLGKAATRFLKSLPVIATGLAIYDTVCDLTSICKDESTGDLRIYDDSAYVGYPQTTGKISYYASGWPSQTMSPTKEIACNKLNAIYSGSGVTYSSSNNSCVGTGVNLTVLSNASCSAGYVEQLGQCVLTVATRPLVEQDWTDAETKLNAQPQQTATALYNSDAPVPVLASTQSAPVTQQIAQTSTQTKDAQGNITGTQVATTSVKVEDTSTTNNVTYNVTEVTTITTYNENNEITNTQTSTVDNQPPKGTDTDETTLSFDDVPNDELEQEEVDLEMPEYESWGDGTCPADVDLGIYGLSISYKPACDVAADLRPFFLLLASVTGMFIIAGISTKE